MCLPTKHSCLQKRKFYFGMNLLESGSAESWIWSIHVAKSSSLAALTLLIWDWFITVESEVEYIWSKPKAAVVKWLYLLPKYTALVLQTLQVVFTAKLYSTSSVPDKMCMMLTTFQIVAMQSLSVAIAMTEMFRVYALSQRSHSVGAVLGLVLFTKVCIYIICDFRFVFTRRPGSGPYCDPPDAPLDVVYLAIFGAGFMYLVLAGMAVIKYVRIGWEGALASLFIRDSAVVFSLILAVLLANLPLRLASAFSNVNNSFHILFSFVIPMISITTSRLIMNMLQVEIPTHPGSLSTISFAITTRISTPYAEHTISDGVL